jgi:hypothetical protein
LFSRWIQIRCPRYFYLPLKTRPSKAFVVNPTLPPFESVLLTNSTPFSPGAIADQQKQSKKSNHRNTQCNNGDA